MRQLIVLLLCWTLGVLAAPAEPTFESARDAFAAGDFDAARAIWEPLARDGDARAQFALGDLHDRGLGVEPDPVRAAQYYRKSADQGLAAAQFNLGNAFEAGKGVPRDPATAAHYWGLAAEQEFPFAQFNLAVLLYDGRGVPADPEAATRWFHRAAANGHPQARALIDAGHIPAPEPPPPVRASVGENDETRRRVTCLAAANEGEVVAQLAAFADADRIAVFLRTNRINQPLHRCRIRAGQRILTALVVGPFPDVATGGRALPSLPPGAWLRPVDSLRAALAFEDEL